MWGPLVGWGQRVCPATPRCLNHLKQGKNQLQEQFPLLKKLIRHPQNAPQGHFRGHSHYTGSKNEAHQKIPQKITKNTEKHSKNNGEIPSSDRWTAKKL